jgi:uncharacterized SAM-dependent methyltransferase
MEHKIFFSEQFKNCKWTINKKKEKTYWFDSPFLLYIEKKQAMAYLEMISKDNFYKTLHQPIEKLVEKYADSIIGNDTDEIELYDLGPGLPTKTLPLIKSMKERKISFKYIPVDISKSFLEIAINEVRKYGVESNGINCLFEELSEKIISKQKEETTRIFLIGLTFNNYRPSQILKLLDKLCGKNDFAIIITEFYEKGKEESILLPYKDVFAENFNFLILELMGFKKSDFSYFTVFNNSRIEMGFKPLHNTSNGIINLKSSDKIITAISYRYSKSSITSFIQKHFKHFEYFQLNDIVTFKIKE